MIEYKQGDLLSVNSGYIVHGCNAQGVMGSGIAKQIKQKYPEAYISYLNHCKNGYSLGTIDVVRVTKDLYIINAITQEFYGRDRSVVYVSYLAIEECITNIGILLKPADELHMPKIGAGLGGGNWDIISAHINRIIPKIKTTVWHL